VTTQLEFWKMLRDWIRRLIEWAYGETLQKKLDELSLRFYQHNREGDVTRNG
jgi:hypothetical protein